MIPLGWGVETYLSAGQIDFFLFFCLGSMEFWAALQNFLCAQVSFRISVVYVFYSGVIPCSLICLQSTLCVFAAYLLTYTGMKLPCQKIGSAASSSYYTSMLLPVNLIGQPQVSLPPARPSSPRLNIQA